MTATIRLATDSDTQAIHAIYEPYVLDTPVSFELEVPSLDEIRQRITSTLTHLPWLVCQVPDGIAGYAYASIHRTRLAYQWSVDVSVYINRPYQRKGIGRALYTSLLNMLRLQGYYNAFAGITIPNVGSVGLHESMGFKPIGVYRAVGYKLGGWHDVGWWQLVLQPYAVEPQAPADFKILQQTTAWKDVLVSGSVFLLRL
jgi:L-amino acid N-acyltransferase YncA